MQTVFGCAITNQCCKVEKRSETERRLTGEWLRISDSCVLMICKLQSTMPSQKTTVLSLEQLRKNFV